MTDRYLLALWAVIPCLLAVVFGLSTGTTVLAVAGGIPAVVFLGYTVVTAWLGVYTEVLPQMKQDLVGAIQYIGGVLS